MYSLDEIKENYRGFSDSKIENIARNESKGLRKEVLAILKNEILRRKLNSSLISWVETEAKPFEGKERELLIKQIKSQSCPKCGKKTELFGFETNIIKSFLIISTTQRKELILCRPCGLNSKANALLITFFTGWWSRKGILLTPFTIIKDLTNYLFINKISTRVINDFINEINGSLRRYGTEDTVITRLINWKNKSSL